MTIAKLCLAFVALFFAGVAGYIAGWANGYDAAARRWRE